MDIYPLPSFITHLTPRIDEVCVSLRQCATEVSSEVLSESQKALALDSLRDYLSEVYSHSCRADHLDVSEQQLSQPLQLNWRKELLDPDKLSSREPPEIPRMGSVVNASSTEGKGDVAGHQSFSFCAILPQSIDVERLGYSCRGALRHPDVPLLTSREVYHHSTSLSGGMPKDVRGSLLDIMRGFDSFLRDVIVSLSRDRNPLTGFIFNDGIEEMDPGGVQSAGTPNFGLNGSVSSIFCSSSHETLEAPAVWFHDRMRASVCEHSSAKQNQESTRACGEARGLSSPGRHLLTERRMSSSASLYISWEGVLKTGRLLCDFVRYVLFSDAALSLLTPSVCLDRGGAPNDTPENNSLSSCPKSAENSSDVAALLSALVELRYTVYAHVKERILAGMQASLPSVSSTELDEAAMCRAMLPWWLWSFAAMGLHEMDLSDKGAACEGRCLSETSFEPLAFLIKCTDYLGRQTIRAQFHTEVAFSEQSLSLFLDANSHHEIRPGGSLSPLPPNEVAQSNLPDSAYDVVAIGDSAIQTDISAGAEVKRKRNPVVIQASFGYASAIKGNGSDSEKPDCKLFLPNNSRSQGESVLLGAPKCSSLVNDSSGSICTQGATVSCMRSTHLTFEDTTDASSSQTKVLAKGRIGEHRAADTLATSDATYCPFYHTHGPHNIATGNSSWNRDPICDQHLSLQQKSLSESSSLFDKANFEDVREGDCEGDSLCLFNSLVAEGAVSSANIALNLASKLGALYTAQDMDALLTLLPDTGVPKQTKQQVAACDTQIQSNTLPSHPPFKNLPYLARDIHFPAISSTPPASSFGSPLHDNKQCEDKDPELPLPTGVFQPQKTYQILCDGQLGHLDEFMCALCSTLRPASMLALDVKASFEMSMRISLKLLNYIFTHHFSHHLALSLYIEPSQPPQRSTSDLSPCPFCFLDPTWAGMVKSLTDTCARAAAQSLTDHHHAILQELIDTLSLLEVQRFTVARIPSLRIRDEGPAPHEGDDEDGGGNNSGDLQPQSSVRADAQPRAAFLRVWLAGFQGASETAQNLLKCGCSSLSPFETIVWYLAGLADYLVQVEQRTWGLLNGSTSIVHDNTFTSLPLIPPHLTQGALLGEVILPVEFLNSIVKFMGTLASLFTCNISWEIMWAEERLNDLNGGAESVGDSDNDEMYSSQSFIYISEPQRIARSLDNLRSGNFHWIKLCIHYFLEIIDVLLRCSIHLPEKPFFLYALVAGLSCCAPADDKRPSDDSGAQQQHDVSALGPHPNDFIAVAWHRALFSADSCLTQIHHFVSNYSCAVVQKSLNKTLSVHAGMELVVCQSKSHPNGTTGGAAASEGKATPFHKSTQLESMAHDRCGAVLFPPRQCSSHFINLQTTIYKNPYRSIQSAVSTMCWPTESFQHHCRVQRILEHTQLVANFLADGPLKALQRILHGREDNSDGCVHHINRANEAGPLLFSSVALLLDVVSGPYAQLLSLSCGGHLSSILPCRCSFIQGSPSLEAEGQSDHIHCSDYTCLSRNSLKSCLAATCDGLWLSTCLLELLSSAAAPINYMQYSIFTEKRRANGFPTSITDAGVQEHHRILRLLFQNTFSVLPSSSSSTYVHLLFLRIVHVFYSNLQLKIGKNDNTEDIDLCSLPYPYSFYQPLLEHWQQYCQSLLRALRVVCWYHGKAYQTAHRLHIPSVLTRFLLSLSIENPVDAPRIFSEMENTSPSYPGPTLVGLVGRSGIERRSGNASSKISAPSDTATFSGHKDRCGTKAQGKGRRPMWQGEHKQKSDSVSGTGASAHGSLMPAFSTPIGTSGARLLKGKDFDLPSPSSKQSAPPVGCSSVLLPANSSPLADDSVLVPKLHLADLEVPHHSSSLTHTQVPVERIVSTVASYTSCGKSKTQWLGVDDRLVMRLSPSKMASSLLAKDSHIHGLMDSDLRLSHKVPLQSTCGALRSNSDCLRQIIKKHSTCDKSESKRKDGTACMGNDGTTLRRPIVPPLFEIATHIDPALMPLSGGMSSLNRVNSSPKGPIVNYYSGRAAHTPPSNASSPNGFVDSTFSTAAGLTLMKSPSILTELILCISGLVLQRESGFIGYDFTVSSLVQNRLLPSHTTTKPENIFCFGSGMNEAFPTQGCQCVTVADAISTPQALAGIHVLGDLQCYLHRHCCESVVRAVNSWLDQQYGKMLAQLAKTQLSSGAQCRFFDSLLQQFVMGNDEVYNSSIHTLLNQTDTLFEPLSSGHYVLLRLLLPRRDWLRNFPVCRRIGAGGFGSVYRAAPLLPQLNMLKGAGVESCSLVDRHEAEAVSLFATGNLAIKLIPVAFHGGRSASLSLCHSEVLALYRLRGHPHIISLLSFGCSGEEFFIMTPEYTGGSLLSWRLEQYLVGFGALSEKIHATFISDTDDASSPRGGTPPPYIPSFFSQCARVFTQVLMAVEFAHRHNIRHGDLKAANVFIEEELRFTPERSDNGDAKSHSDDTSAGGNASLQKGSTALRRQVFSLPTMVRLGDFGSCDSCDEEDMRMLFSDVAAGEARFMAARWGSAKGTEAVQPPEVMVPRRRYQIFRGFLNDYFNQGVPRQEHDSGDDRFDCPLFCEVPDANPNSGGPFEGTDSPRTHETGGKLENLLKRMQRVELSADIWGCGCLLYELLTGCMLFGGTRLGNLAVLANAAPHKLLANSFSCYGDTAGPHDMFHSDCSPTTDCKASRHVTHNTRRYCAAQGSALGTALNEQEQHDLAKSVGKVVLEFLCQLLSLDPLERPTSPEALHRWVEITRESYPNFE
ncbi:unnamed protein product [Phytomonas sp. EM1]|nr:unnamed protein product [Phytomonas sp. EM1]|eukprot:CCW60123.1 unnamed protein product [Phytomonas sp. isolate EM1]